MAKAARSSEKVPKSRAALTPEAREKQLIALAIDVAEEQMRNGTASSQVISHFLKLGSTRAQIEKELLEKQRDLAAAKAEAIESSAKMEDLYLKAAKAMKSYQGQEDEEDELKAIQSLFFFQPLKIALSIFGLTASSAKRLSASTVI